jgi:DNA-binding GntR family transcriptional regulator
MPIPGAAEPISQTKASDVVFLTLRGWIIDGVLEPGETLRDADLATSFGISRTPVREALLRLEREGLIETQPGRWTRVTPLDPGELRRIYPVWLGLETLAATLAAREPGLEALLPEIEAALRECEAATEHALAAPSPEARHAARECDARFHDTILNATRNAYLETALQPLQSAMRRFANVAHPESVMPDEHSLREHTRLVAALRDHDPATATAAARDDLEHAWAFVVPNDA